MSEVDLYAAEAKFNKAKTEYISLMNTIKTTCLGKEKTSKKCQKAAELNAEMQTYLIQMSNSMKKGSTTEYVPKQMELYNVANQLEDDKKDIITNSASLQDLAVTADMNHTNYIVWSLSAVTVFSLIVFFWKKKIIDHTNGISE